MSTETSPVHLTICSKHVSDFTGYYFHQCRKPAKWMTIAGPRCGIHARQWKKSRTPLKVAVLTVEGKL